MKRELFHGSENIIEKPAFGLGKVYNDFGQGFYLTEYIDMAREWGSTNEYIGYVNKYVIEDKNLKILNLLDKKYNELNWLAALIKNREFKLTSKIMKEGKKYIISKFDVNTDNYDVVIGYRADDAYFQYVKAFLNNGITYEQLKKSMYLGKLGEQYVLKSKKAFETIKYIGHEKIESDVYLASRKNRDKIARDEYLSINLDKGSSSTYLNEIIKHGL